MLVLARQLGASDFGAFTLVFSLVLLANALPSNLVTQPHNVFGAPLRESAYSEYTSSTALSQVFLTTALGGLLAVAGLVALFLGFGFSSLLFAAIPALAAGQLQEFTRRVLYTEDRLGAVLVNDLIGNVGRVPVLVFVAFHESLTPTLGFHAMAAASTFGTVVGILQIRRSLAWRVAVPLIRRNIAFGKWLLGSELTALVAGQLYVYIVAAFVGPAGAGVLKAAQLLVSPLNIPQFYLFSVLPGRFARAYDHGGLKALLDRVRDALISTMPLVTAFCIALALLAKPLLALVYGDEYSGAASVLVILAAQGFVSTLFPILGGALRALRAPHLLFKGNLWASALSVGFGWAFVARWGVEGAAIGMTLRTIFVTAYLWLGFKREASLGSTVLREPANE